MSALIPSSKSSAKDLDPHLWSMLQNWKAEEEKYSGESTPTTSRRQVYIKVPNHTESLRGLKTS
ncbi:MAG: hypothetical protein R2818_13340 [Flavobacteriales bacterium]